MIVALATASGLSACSAEPTKASKPHRSAIQPGGPQAQPGYTVDVELPKEATRGQESLARVRVRPKAPWHMNLEYPAKLHLTAPDDVTLDASLLEKGDAERYDGEGLVFSVLFTPEAKGARKIEAQVDFAVCGDDACGPVTESVELAFEVGCRIEDTGLC